MTQQDEFDGRPVTDRKIKITGAGDGLSKALQLESADLHADDQVTVILRGKVEGAVFKRDKDEDGYIRIDNIVAKAARIAPSGFAELEGLMDEHEAAVNEMLATEEEKKKGIEQIEFPPEDDVVQAAEDGVAPKGSPRNPHRQSDLEAVPDL